MKRAASTVVVTLVLTATVGLQGQVQETASDPPQQAPAQGRIGGASGNQQERLVPGMAGYTRDVLFGDVWRRPDLSPRDRSLVVISALIATNKPAQLQGHLRRALGNGVTPVEASGVLTHLAVYSGWPSAVSALDVYEQVYTSRNVDLASLRAVRAPLPVPAWNAARERATNDEFGTIAPKFADLTNDVVFGDLWRRSDLSVRDRSLVTIAALAGMGDDDQLDFYLRLAIESGLTPDQIAEAFTHLAFYAGWSKATKAMTAAARVLQASQPYPVGNPLDLPVVPAADGRFDPISANVEVYGSVYSAESCSYDPDRGAIVIPNRGVPPNVRTNDAWITLMNHDGSIHTARWIGVQQGNQRDALAPPLRLNEPYGSDLVDGVLYLADRDGGGGANDPTVSVVRRFDMKTGAPLGDIVVSGASWFNDIAVARDGTLYGTIPGANQVWRVLPAGEASIFVQGAPLDRPNGVALDRDGSVVVVNTNSDAVFTFSREGALTRTEHAAQSGSDGLVIMEDGTKYVSSVRHGGISRIRPGRSAELIAENIPNAASMCYDSGARQLVIPMNANNAIALLTLE